jgi:hypothetical protein
LQEELAGEANVFGFFLGLKLPIERTDAVQKELREISQSDGVTAGDAFASELFDEIAEEEIHGTGRGEVIYVAEKVGGEDFRFDGRCGSAETIGVVGAERGALGSVGGTMGFVD